MKVKIFSKILPDELEKEINIFLVENSNKNIIDIKFQEHLNGYSALIIYK